MSVTFEPCLKNDWQKTFGVSREAVIDALKGDGWLDRLSTIRPDLYPNGLQTRIVEQDNFTLGILTSSTEPPRTSMPYLIKAYRTFNFRNNPRLAHGSTMIDPTLQGSGIGQSILLHMVETVRLIGGNELTGEASEMGPEFWLRNGAVAHAWLTPKVSHDASVEFERRLQRIIDTPGLYAPEWSRGSVEWLSHLREQQNPRGMSEIAARNDLFVLNDARERTRLGKYLLTKIYIGGISFKFDDPWTISRLRSQLGYDVVNGTRLHNFQRPASRPKNLALLHAAL